MRLEPLAIETLDAETRARLDMAEEIMGFTPNDGLVMARNPALLKAVAALVGAVYGAGKISPELKRLIGEAASKAAGCFYCAAHAAKGAETQGADTAKIAAIWAFEENDLFSDAERAAIRVAIKSGRTPNETTDADFDQLKKHFNDDEILEIVSVIALFGFLNRFNSTLDTMVEPSVTEAVMRLGLDGKA